MQVLINLAMAEDRADADEDLEFLVEFGDRPIPRAGEAIEFDLDVSIIVDRVHHAFGREASAEDGPETWIYCALGSVEAGLGRSLQRYKELLREFAAVNFGRERADGLEGGTR